MKVVCYGSLNIDHVYEVPHFVRPGETLAVTGYRQFCGGKGLNQSIALARAGLPVHHAGRVGPDGAMLLQRLQENGVDTSAVRTGSGATGHAVIQVNAEGQNCILLHGGENQAIIAEEIRETLQGFGPGDLLLLQNETSGLREMIEAAAARGMTVALNPAPMDASVGALPLDKVGILILNEIEGEGLTGTPEPQAMADRLLERNPEARVVITLGAQGALYADRNGTHRQQAYPVEAVDTTAAGDTFTGYLLAGLLEGLAPEQAMDRAARASALCVTRPGAADSVPFAREVNA